jgi:DNA-directed RNA polymerase subunit M/transcription elongation factor TFIIS
MSGKLANIHIDPLEQSGSRKTKTRGLPPLQVQTQQSSENQAISSIPELQLISQIPGSQPFLIQDMIPDVVFLLQYEGSKAFIGTLPKDENRNIITANPTGLAVMRPEELLQILINQTLDALLVSLQLITGISPNDLLTRIYNLGLQVLAGLFGRADPLNPSSLIFGHESQEIHVKTREIEIDIIKNEPEVTESATETCACGSKNVRTVPVQMRGGDEPATILARCGKCKLQWRFSSA